jgi:guanylate kinase
MSKGKIGKVLLELALIAWPWVKEHVLPLIKEFVKNVVIKHLSQFLEKMKTDIDKHFEKRYQNATEKANEAERNASQASTDSEKQKYEDIAKIWRQVADELRIENEELKTKIKDLTIEAENGIINETNNMDPKINKKTGTILIEYKK